MNGEKAYLEGEDAMPLTKKKDGLGEEIESFNLQKQRVTAGGKLFCMQFDAMIRKRYYYFKRDRKGLCCEMLAPLFLVALACLFTKMNWFKKSPPLEFTPDLIDTPQHIMLNDNNTPPGFIENFPSEFEVKEVDVTTL